MKSGNMCLALAAFLLSTTSAVALGVPGKDESVRITTIVGLNNIQQIGSTQNINDVNGNAITANPNPYKVVVVPENLKTLARGTVLVSNIGNDGDRHESVTLLWPYAERSSP